MADSTDAWLQGISIGAGIASDAMNRNLRMQELRSMQAMRQLQERQTAEAMRLQLEQANLATQYRADMEKAMQQTQLETSPVIPIPGSPFGVAPNPSQLSMDRALLKNVAPVIGKYNPDKLGPFVQDVAMLQYRQNAMQPEVKTVTDEATGDQVSMIRTGPNSWSRVPESAAKRQEQAFENQNRGKVLAFALKNAPELVEFDDRGQPKPMTEENYRIAAQRAGLTGATKTREEQKQTTGSTVFNIGKRLAPLLTQENTGVRGMARRAFDSIKGQLGDDVKISNASETVSVAKQFQSAMIKSMMSDSNIAEAERKKIESAMPAPDAWFKSAQDARISLASALELMGTTSRAGAESLGKPIRSEWLTPVEIRDKLASKEISMEQARELMNNNGWVLINMLKQSQQQ